MGMQRCREGVSLLALALGFVRRSPGRSFAAVGGITIAFLLLSGADNTVTTASSTILDAVLEELPYDLKVTAGSSTYPLTLLMEELERQKVEYLIGIRYAAEPMIKLSRAGTTLNLSGQGLMSLAVWKADNKALARVGLVTNQSFDLEQDEILIETNLARTLEHSLGSLSIGDRITLYIGEGYDPSSVQVRLAGFFSIDNQTYRSNPGKKIGLGFLAPNPRLVISNLAVENLNQAAGWGQAIVLVFVDRARMVDSRNIGASRSSLNQIAFDIETGTSGFVQVDNLLGDSLTQELSGLSSLNRFYVSTGLPILLLGALLAFVGLELIQLSQRDEISSLMSRGASPRQIQAVLVLQAFFLGAAGAALGTLIGPLLLPFFFTPRYAAAILASLPLPRASFAVRTVVVGGALTGLASFLSARRVVRVEDPYPRWSTQREEPGRGAQPGGLLHSLSPLFLVLPIIFLVSVFVEPLVGGGFLKASNRELGGPPFRFEPESVPNRGRRLLDTVRAIQPGGVGLKTLGSVERGYMPLPVQPDIYASIMRLEQRTAEQQRLAAGAAARQPSALRRMMARLGRLGGGSKQVLGGCGGY